MSVDYLKPTEEVKYLLKKIRRKYYQEFHKAKIVTLLRTGNWNKYGTISRVSKKQKQAGVDGDYILTLNNEAWKTFSLKQKKALIDHELCHMKIKKSRKGKVFALRHHDVEEFGVIVKRYGKWTPALEKFSEVLK